MAIPETSESPDAQLTALRPRRTPATALLVSLRPRQWTKNLLLLAGIVFAADIEDPGAWLRALSALAIYCAASSAAYLVNDVRDAAADRRHPVKRRRPIARRELSRRRALGAAAALAAVALVGAAALGPAALALLAGFLALQAVYTARLKDVVLLDVMAIAGLFVIRAAAGADAVAVRVSPWLLVCTGLLALFLALGKRRAELVSVSSERSSGRLVLDGYSLALVEQLVTVVAAATVLAYTIYSLTAHETQGLAWTVPFVVFGVFRYLLLLQRAAAGEEPENVFLTDRPILATVALWAAACAAILFAAER